MPPATEAQSPNHWTAREFPGRGLRNSKYDQRHLYVKSNNNNNNNNKLFTKWKETDIENKLMVIKGENEVKVAQWCPIL